MSDPDTVTELHPTADPGTEPNPAGSGTTDVEGDQPNPAPGAERT